ncbi:MAG: hypothetical protein ACJ8AO_15065 [Gemmatimonadaceae bacterium]
MREGAERGAARAVVARAPVRVDFGGGWTDVPPYTTELGGAVCNMAISLRATVRLTSEGGRADAAVGMLGADTALAEAALRRAGLEGVTATLRSDFPVGAGLGGSSAAGVAVQAALACWRGEAVDRDALAQRSRQVEVEDLGIAGGYQDHYAAAHGGALLMEFTDRVSVRRLPLAPAVREALARRCVVAYTGQSRISGETITAVLDAYRAREPRVTGALARMKALAREMADAITRESVDDLGALVGEHWEHQRALHHGITTGRIDAMVAAARAAGALGCKALGASGGGCVLVIAREGAVQPVRAAVGALGELLAFEVDETGAVAADEERRA